MKIIYVVLETTPKHTSFFCSLPNKYSCLLQVLWVACGIKENNSKNKLVGISKLNFALSFSQLESLDKVGYCPMVRLNTARVAVCAQNCVESLVFPFCMCPSPKNWTEPCSVMHQQCTWGDLLALLPTDLLSSVFLLEDTCWCWAWSSSSCTVISCSRFNYSLGKVISEV